MTRHQRRCTLPTMTAARQIRQPKCHMKLWPLWTMQTNINNNSDSFSQRNHLFYWKKWRGHYLCILHSRSHPGDIRPVASGDDTRRVKSRNEYVHRLRVVHTRHCYHNGPLSNSCHSNKQQQHQHMLRAPAVGLVYQPSLPVTVTIAMKTRSVANNYGRVHKSIPGLLCSWTKTLRSNNRNL